MITGNSLTDRLVLFMAASLGASGVVLAAAATHTGATHMLGNASTMCLAHAPALLALGALRNRLRTARLAAIILGAGTILFTTDLLTRHFMESSLFAFAAPVGGALMILGWLTAAVGALFSSGQKQDHAG